MISEEDSKRLAEVIKKMNQYSDGIHRASEAHKELTNEMQRAQSFRKKQKDDLEQIRKAHKRTRIAALAAKKEQVRGEKAKKEATDEYNKAVQELYGGTIPAAEKTQITMKKNEVRGWRKLTNAANEYENTLKNLKTVNFAGLKKYQAAMQEAFLSKKPIKNIKELTDAHLDMIKANAEAAKSMGLEGPKVPTTAKELKELERVSFSGYAQNFKHTMTESSEDVMDNLIEDYKNAGSEMERMDILEKALDIEGAVKNLEQMKLKSGKMSFFTGTGGAAFGAGKSLLKGDQGGLQQQAKKMQDWAMAAKASGKKLGFLGKNIGKLAGFLGKLGRLNWVFALITALGKMISVFNDLDKYVKGLNQEFLNMAGPAGALENAEQSMIDFNRTIHDLQRNLKLGLLPKEIQSFFGAVSGAGMSLQGVIKAVGDYGDIIEESRKMSLEFGVSMDEMGKMVTTQMLEMRSSLSDVSDAFEKLSYDAAMAGVSSTKFYNAIESTALSLEFYGNSLKFVSGLLTDIKKTGRIGFQGAEDLAKTYTEMFKGMGLTDKMKLIQLVGVDEMRNIFEEIGQRAEKRLQNLSRQMSVMTAEGKQLSEQDKKRLEALKEQQKRLRDQAAYYDEIAQTGDIGRMAQALSGAAAEGFSPYLIQRIMEMRGQGPGMYGGGEGETIARTTLMTTLLKMSEEQAEKTQELFRTFIRTFEGLNKGALRLSQQFVLGDDTMRNLLQRVKDTGEGFEELRPELIKKLTEANKDLFDNEQDLNRAVEALVDAVSNNEDLLLDQGITAEEYARQAFGTMGTRTRGRAGLSDTGMKELIDQTMPLEKMLNITKHSLKYELADNMLFRSMNNWLQDIFVLLGDILGAVKLPWKKTPEQRAQEKMNKWLQDDMQEYLNLQQNLAKNITGISKKRKELSAATNTEDIKRLQQEITAEEERMNENLQKISESERASGKERELAGLRSTMVQELIDKITSEEDGGPELPLRSIEDRFLEMLGIDPYQHHLASGRYGSFGQFSPTAATRPVKTNQDFSAMSDGYVKVKSGDVVVNSGTLAKGLGGGMGQFSNQVLAKSNMGGMGGSQHNWGGINIFFQAPADSTNPNAYKKMFMDAVEQIVDRKMYAEKQRIS